MRGNREEKKFDIFIAYETGTGLDYAKNLKEAIKRHDPSLRSFVADIDFPQTQKIPEIINQYLDQCRFFIPIYTQNANKSLAMNSEVEFALKNEKKMEFIICQHKKFKGEIPPEFSEYIRVEFETPQELNRGVTAVLDQDHSFHDPCTKELETMGIHKIFPNRRNCKELDDMIKREIKISSEINIMANTARDFFGDKNTSKFYNDIIHFLKEGETSTKKINLILLNPFSDAAIDRYTIEYFGAEGASREGFFNNFINSTFFRDIEQVINSYAEYAKNCKSHNCIELKLSSLTPTLFFIKTKNYIFIEFYHNSPLFMANIFPGKHDKGAVCIGGYLPVFVIKNESTFGKLMDGHFIFSWKKSVAWDSTDEEIKKFKLDPSLYKLLHLISELHEKSEIFR